MIFPKERLVIGHNLFQTVILRVVSDDQDRPICAPGMSARYWVKKLMPVHPSGFNGHIPEVYGVPFIQCKVMFFMCLSKSESLLQMCLTLGYRL